ncbi:MAG: DUF86 domain-containing protein [Ignavibacteriales bacterium]
MPSKSDAALLHIRDNIVFARQWSAGMSLADFSEDRIIFYAVTRCLEIISEAARRLSPEILKRHPEMPWRTIMDAGDYYRHAYDGVEERIVFTTVKESLPALAAVIEEEIARAERLNSR